MTWWLIYFAAWLGPAVVATVFTRIARDIAPRLGFVDKPLNEAHKRHVSVTPVFGGAAMLSAWLVSLAGGVLVAMLLRGSLPANVMEHLINAKAVSGRLLVLVGCATGMSLLGMLDDRLALKAWQKFLGQAVFAGIAAAWGVRVTALFSLPIVTWGLTVFWILLIVNALNFLDNMDGLAGGISALAAFLFLFTAAARGQHFVAILAAVTFGTACGFLVYNKPKASIFMGDAGSHFLGFNLAVIGALTTFYTQESQTLAPLLTPILILGVPIFDTFAVVVIRWRAGQPIYVGDNRHISHRFQHLGMSRPVAVLLVCLLSFTVGCGAVALMWLPPAGVVVVLLQSALVFAIISIIQFYVPKKES
jgi:UDP-GlcNAc:undecaprenyl-phosphate GlcNAc-1-phosphate transferase